MKIIRQLKGFADSTDIRISAFELWKRVFLGSVNKNNSEYPLVKDHNYYSNGDAILSGKGNILYIYSIDGYPRELPNNFRESLRQDTKGVTKIAYISVFESAEINWDSSKMKFKLKTWKSINEDETQVDEFNYNENIGSMDTNEWRKNSLLYLSDATSRRRRKMFKYRTIMLISGERGSDFDETVKEVKTHCNNLSLKISRITDNIEDFLDYFSPYSQNENPRVLKEVGNTTVSDEMLSRLCSYDQGKIGDDGDYWGTDIKSGFPVYKTIRKTIVDAENILIVGETGSGKSYLGKNVIAQLLGKSYIRGTINDIEGKEYLPLASYIAMDYDVVVINMGEGTGRYYDPVAICITGDMDMDSSMFSYSKSYTKAILKALVGKKVMAREWTDVIINDGVARTYSKEGVTNDIKSWGLSKDLTLYNVYYSLKDIYREVYSDSISSELAMQYKNNKGYQDTLDLVIAKLGVFFEPLENGGTRSDVFMDRVTLDEIRFAKLVICSFGLEGRSTDTVDEVLMSLMQSSAANISHLRSMFAKLDGMYNFKVWEEFQRWGALPDSEKTISTTLTGGRKVGDINIIISNRPQELLDNDKFGIFGNTTSFAIGAIDDSKTRKELCDRLSIPMLLPDLDNIVNKKGDNKSFSSSNIENTNPYNKAFLVKLDKSITTIVKLDLPDSIAKSDIFRTGDVLKKAKE